MAREIIENSFNNLMKSNLLELYSQTMISALISGLKSILHFHPGPIIY
jgi:hypothetical protein